MRASFAIAGRSSGFAKADTRAAILASVTAYRETMAVFAQMGTMDTGYSHLDEDELMSAVRSRMPGPEQAPPGARGYRMLIARAITSAARATDPAASSIMRSFAHGLIAEISVGLNAMAVQKPSDR